MILQADDPASRAADVTAALQTAGILGNSEILSVAEEPISSKGLMSALSRITVEFGTKAPDVPDTLILKQESRDATAVRIAVRLHMAERECNFYRDNQRLMSPRTPICYHVDGPSEGRFSLLLEDLGRLEQPDQLSGCDAEVASAVVVALARLHARTWARASEFPPGRYPRLTDEVVLGLQKEYHDRWAAFVSMHGDRLPHDAVAVAERFGADMPQLLDTWEKAESNCLIHGDVRADNVLLEKADRSAILLDWQLAMIAPAAADLAHFLCGSLTTSVRKAEEAGLLDLYFTELRACGVRGYGRDELSDDYRRCLLLVLPLNVIFGTTKANSAAGDALRAVVLDRYFGALLDLGCQEFLAS